MMSTYRAKLLELDTLLAANHIDLVKLKKICFHGIPDSSSQCLRPLCWRLLLNYLPLSKSDWEQSLEKSRSLYKQFVDEMIVAPGQSDNASSIDHPLSLDPDSQWGVFFKDNEVLQQIDKDVRRLCPDISFFQQPCDFPCLPVVSSQGVRRLHRRVQRIVLNSANVERRGLGVTKIALCVRKATEDYEPLEEGSEAHWEVVERLLFLYAKLNPGQGYVQGMNELIGPIYYAFASDPDPAWREHAEADCFFCFTNLMGETRDFFIKTLDESQCGIVSMMARVSSQLKRNDFQTWARLTEQELRPEYYSFRWLTLLLSQEFPLPDVLRIWDSLFSDENRFDFLIHICCAMIIAYKKMEDLHQHISPQFFSTLQNLNLNELMPVFPLYIKIFYAVSLSSGVGPKSFKQLLWEKQHMIYFIKNSFIQEHEGYGLRDFSSQQQGKLLRDQILNNEFSSNVKLLQNFPPTDIHIVLSKAAQLCSSTLN